MSLLVPVAPTDTCEATVAWAIDQLAEDPPEGARLHLVTTLTPARAPRRERAARAHLDRMAATARDRIDGAIVVEAALLATDRYLATPNAHADVLAAYASDRGIERVGLDPRFAFDATDRTLQPPAPALDRAGLAVERAPVDRRRWSLPSERARIGAIALVAFLFYLAVGDPRAPSDLAKGAVAATVAGLLFRNVAFETTPTIVAAGGVAVRGLLYVPYLLGKILVANVQISYIVLHPRLPIDPHLDRVETRLGAGLPVTGLANSLTLTPGTLTVDVDGADLVVHSITHAARREVLAGVRTRWLAFVFGDPAPRTDRGIDPSRVETLAGPTDAASLWEDDDA